jgi:aromatic ring hydroxylase
VIAQRDAIAAWARISYGWMGRSPDYKAAFLNTLGANAEFYDKRASRCYRPVIGERAPVDQESRACDAIR